VASTVLQHKPLSSSARRELEGLQEQSVQRTYQAGEVIWRTHGPLRFSGTLQSGEIELETWVDGRLVRTRRLRAGDLFPPRSLRDRRLHETVIARALSDVQVTILPENQERTASKGVARKGMGWLLPVLLLLLVFLLAWDDIARITSGLFYLAATNEEATASLEVPGSMELLQAAQKVDKGASFAYNEEGYRWFLQNNLSDSSRAFDEAVARDPASAPALNNLAVTDFTQGDLSRAAGIFQQAIEQAPDNPITRYNLGVTLMQLGDPTGALREFQESGFIDPKDVSPLLQQADLYLQTGDYARAEQNARSVMQLNPSFLPANLLLGMALYNQGREADALASFETALKLDPGNRVADFYRALILGHQKQYDAALPVLYGLLASSTDAAESARILVEIDALYRFKSEPASTGP